ncbi:MAG: hypothetical protein J4G03_06335 [Gemmatimonadetes bacterium]|nr:hypothetical protein [Gemmatimonadota bacterium]
MTDCLRKVCPAGAVPGVAALAGCMAVASLAAAAPAWAQGVTLRLQPEVGQVYEYSLSIESVMNGVPGFPDAPMQISVSELSEVTAADENEFEATVTYEVAMDAAFGAEPEVPEAGAQSVRYSTRGEFLDRTDESVEFGGLVGMDGLAGSQLAAVILPAGAVSVGDTWADSTSAPLPVVGGAEEIEFVRTFTLEAVEGDVAVIAVRSEFNENVVIDAGGMPMTMAVQLASDGTARFDVARGLLLQMDAVTSNQMDMTVPGMGPLTVQVEGSMSVLLSGTSEAGGN